ncbi:MAG: marine proteobacterial sortase target protein [Hyphomicrobiales bacterium]|nr:marine proteobacterial sortase target protein [Hyphomicrobiales bacterium]
MIFNGNKNNHNNSGKNHVGNNLPTKIHHVTITDPDTQSRAHAGTTPQHSGLPLKNTTHRRWAVTGIFNIIFIPLMIGIIAFASILMIVFTTWNTATAKNSVKRIGIESIKIARLVRPNDMKSGGLLFPSKREGQFVEAPRLATDVKIDISGPIVRTIVSQRFENPSKNYVEGIYVFPLPENSAVDTLKMQIGDRLIEGIIKPRAEARKIYEEAKIQGKKASLLEQQRPNIFTNAVANIGPGETIIVQIEYQQTIKQSSGLFSLRFPMVVGPRYNPQPIKHTVDFNNNGNKTAGWGSIDPVTDREKITPPVLDSSENAIINPVTIKVHLAAGFPLGDVKSVYHSMATTDENESTRTLELVDKNITADRDFELTWKARGTTPNAALFKEQIRGKDYILAFITPPAVRPQNHIVKNRETIFVIDNSGSMGGQSIIQAKFALSDALSRLSSKDKFNIIRFDDTYELLFPKAVMAIAKNINRARNFVSNLEADGGTEMLPALQASLVDNNTGNNEHIRQVIFITDGAIGNEQQLFDAIASGRGRSRVFTIGIGSAPNTFFMRRAAEMGRGTFTHIGATNEVEERMTAFFDKLENPVLTGLQAEVQGGILSSVSPDPLPDLYAGEPIVLAAQMKSAEGMLTITGDYGDQPWQISMQLDNAASGKGIGRLWARRRIASLEASRSYSNDSKNIDRNIEVTALDHHLVSRLTSLVAVDVSPTRPKDKDLVSKELPTNLPDGWEFEKLFDRADQSPPMMQKTRAYQKASYQRTAQLMTAAPNPQITRGLVQNNLQAVVLPKTATDADRNIILGAMLVLLAALITLITAMWQNVGNISRQHALAQAKREYNRLP